MTRRTRIGAALAAGMLVVATLSAAPGFWQAGTQADFLRGDVEQLSIDEHGRLTLGPELATVYDAGTPFVWTMLPGADGALFLGTGNDGKVIRVDRNGQGSVLFDSSEMEVHALAPAPAGGLYVATSPDGRIYKVDAKGQATTFFDPSEKYIWSLAVDRQGNVFAGTGDKGTVYRVTADGQGTKFFSTKATHAVSLAFDAGNQLLIGTGAPGRVFRVDNAGRGFLLLDLRSCPEQPGRHWRRQRVRAGVGAACRDAIHSQRLDRDHLGLGDRRTRRIPGLRLGSTGPAKRERRNFPHPARWPVGSDLVAGRGCSVRHQHRSRRRPARGDRRQGQAV